MGTGYTVTFLAVLFTFVLSNAPGRAGGADEDKGGNSDVSFFHWDLNASGFYSARGTDLRGTDSSHWQPTDMLPRNYVGFEYIRMIGERSRWRSFLDPLELTTIDLNPHIEIDLNPPMDGSMMGPSCNQPSVDWHTTSVDFNRDDGKRTIAVKLVLHDFWARFEPRGMERTSLRVGHFDIPYGVNPIMAPRGGVFVMPPEIDDIGFKKDWGAVWKGPLAEYDYELALTTGTGLGLHAPYWFVDSSRASFAASARVGAPTYWDFQYGLSALYGKIPRIMADERLDQNAPGRWRVSGDAFYRIQQHTVFMAQLGFGQDGNDPSSLEAGNTKVLSGHVLVAHVPPWWEWLDFKLQFKGVNYDLDASCATRTFLLGEVAYSLTTAVMVRFDYVHEFAVPRFMSAMGRKADDRLYLTINYYL